MDPGAQTRAPTEVGPAAAPVAQAAHGEAVRALLAAQDGSVYSGGADGRIVQWNFAPVASLLERGARVERFEDGNLTVTDDGDVVTESARAHT